MKDIKKLLVIRFSAMGDVAMTTPVIYSLVKQFPDVEVSVLSRTAFSKFFNDPKIKFIGVNFDEYKGIWGLFRLYKELKTKNFDAVADLHSVLRSRILSFFFRLGGVRVARLNKGRKEKHQLTRRHNKKLEKLTPMVVRYQQVFFKLGFDVQISSFESILKGKKLRLHEKGDITGIKDCKWIGVAPFAKHKGKIYPIEKMEEVVKHFSADPNVKVFLFGGGKKELEILECWENKYHDAICLAGKLDFRGEMDVINRLDVMISMDSANMHLASMVNTPVISVWGATHPNAGFYGWNQKPENAIQLDVECRPCSIYGEKECFRGDYICLTEIEPKTIIEKVEKFLNAN